MTTPRSRAEANWLEVQSHYLAQVRKVCNKYECPLVIAGDVFDSGWKDTGCPPELTNYAIAEFRQFKGGVLAVPGQHDLPNHRIMDIKKSAYWTLVEAGVMTDLTPGLSGSWEDADNRVMYHGFPWGQKLEPLPREWRISHKGWTHVAVVHKYLWVEGKGHKEAVEEDKPHHLKTSLRGFDVVLVGDNHRSWYLEV